MAKRKKKPNNDASVDQINISSANQQLQSKMMQLPQEIRDEIYNMLFCSTRLAFRKRVWYSPFDDEEITFAARGTALALLRTCRRVRDEIGVSWLHHVLFHFEDPKELLDTLCRIPIALRNQIRHLRVPGWTMRLTFEGDSDVYYSTAQILKLLPGLALDTLTVLGDNRHGRFSYETLNMLVRNPQGWRELQYLSPSTEFLGYKYDADYEADRYLRRPQPSDWRNALEQRDGKGRNCSVVIYRVTDPTGRCAILQPSTREVFTQAIPAGQDVQSFGKVEDPTLMCPGEIEKAVLVVVKRGDGVDYAEKEGSPYLSIGDIREDYPGKTWEEIKALEDTSSFYKDDDESNDDDD